MFTGLIQEIGQIDQLKIISEGREFSLLAPQLSPQVKIDDSVAVNGACLTVVSVHPPHIRVQCVQTTLEKSTLGTIRVGQQVNLELALKMGDRLGGHMVTGHVNGVAQITTIRARGQWREITINYPSSLRPYFVQEGSVTLNGVSLTIASLTNKSLTVSIIPHTYKQTTLHQLREGDWINVEVDILAKYVESLLTHTARSYQHASSPPTSQGYQDSLASLLSP
jgi:riboflavin synthase